MSNPPAGGGNSTSLIPQIPQLDMMGNFVVRGRQGKRKGKKDTEGMAEIPQK